jgi:Uma2 family endonuclease
MASQPLDEDPYVGTPDLLVEILSNHNPEHDLVTKKNLYDKFGVKEYWIIDPITKECIVYQLIEKHFILAGKNVSKFFSPLFNHSFTI